ncbi:MAG: CoA transferase [Chloroflexota bacterium]
MGLLALGNVRIVDLSMVWAGPYCSKLLADMGAEVIKIESPRYWDMVRGSPTKPAPGQIGGYIYPDKRPGEHPYNRAGYFNKVNRNKYGITLDLRTRQGAGAFEEMVKISDVVMENFSVGVMRRLGFDYYALRRLKPDIVMLSMPAAGNTGPEKDYVGYGAAIEQLGGIVALTGYRAGRPLKSGINYGDPIAGIHAAGFILAALRHKQRTGEGQLIDLSQRESAACLIGDAIMDYVMNRRVQQPMGNRHSCMAPHGCYRCRGNDMWVTIAVASDEEWSSFCKAAGHPEWMTDERFADSLGRWDHQAELDRLIEGWTAQHDHYELMSILQKAGVAAGAVLQNWEVLADPHLRARGFYQRITHPEAGTYPIPGPTWKLSKTPGTMRMPAPCFGEHNQRILGDLLGMPQQTILSMDQKGVISKEPIR